MPDEIFDNPRLAEIYDSFDGQRVDLYPYLAIAKEFKAQSILDIGCGTGSLACLLSANGFEVTGVDPAKASLAIAQQKPHGDKVKWVFGDSKSIPKKSYDMAFMAGNVAQVFTTDEGWKENLLSINGALNTNGILIFETRNPDKKAWLGWTKEQTYKRIEIKNIGYVEGWCDVTSVSDKFVDFTWTYHFEKDGKVLLSNSTLRFRGREEIVLTLEQSGYDVKEIRDAPDRPELEFVFIAGIKS